METEPERLSTRGRNRVLTETEAKLAEEGCLASLFINYSDEPQRLNMIFDFERNHLELPRKYHDQSHWWNVQMDYAFYNTQDIAGLVSISVPDMNELLGSPSTDRPPTFIKSGNYVLAVNRASEGSVVKVTDVRKLTTEARADFEQIIAELVAAEDN